MTLLFNHIKIAFRNLWKFRVQTIVCVLGLSVGMACFALGTLWLRYIESFEDFVPDAENTYLVTHGKSIFKSGYDYKTYYNDGRRVKENLSEVADYCTFVSLYNDKDFWEAKADGKEEVKTFFVSRADSSFFRFMRIDAIEGSLSHLNLGEVALTRSAAKRLFGKDSPIGMTVMLKETQEYSGDMEPLGAENHRHTVVAVIPDCPRNSRFYYDAVAAFREDDSRIDGSGMYNTFVRLNPLACRDSIVGRQFNLSWKETYASGYEMDYEQVYLIAPIRQLRTEFFDNNVLISTQYVHWFRNLGVLVILCSLFNYLITMAGHLRRRAWEMSLRRVLGASRKTILAMVSTETLFIFLLSAVLGLLFTLAVMPYFREYSSINLPLSEITVKLVVALILVIVSCVAVSALTAWIIMQRTQRNILSSRHLSHFSNKLDRCGVMIQLALSMGILFAVGVMLRQVNYLMYSDDLGFRRTDMGVARLVTEDVKQKIRQSPLVEKYMDEGHHYFPRYVMMGTGVSDIDEPDEIRKVSIEKSWIDSLLVDFFGVQLICGKIPELATESENERGSMEICINEAMCRHFHLTPETAIGKVFYSFNDVMPVCGVVKDMYIAGPTVQPEPCFYFNQISEFSVNDVSVKFITKPGKIQEVCDSVQVWMKQAENISPYTVCQNAEAMFNEFVAAEQMLIKILWAVVLCSLIVCVLGAFSLVSLSLTERRKEIAIRKAHGAHISDILQLFLKTHYLSLAVAALIAYPISYIIMRNWLDNYTKQIGMDWWLIPATFLLISAVVISTISAKIYFAAKEKAARALAG